MWRKINFEVELRLDWIQNLASKRITLLVAKEPSVLKYVTIIGRGKEKFFSFSQKHKSDMKGKHSRQC